MPLQENFRRCILRASPQWHTSCHRRFTIKLENVKLEGVSLDQTSTGTFHLQGSRAAGQQGRASKARHNKHILSCS